MCFYDVMVTFKGERGEAAAAAVAEAFTEAGAVAGQYAPLDERGVTALNYLVLGTADNSALTADADGRLANTADLKALLTRISRATGAQIVYVTKLVEGSVDVEEFEDIEDAEAARDLVFREARSVAVGRVGHEWASRLSAVTFQDVHLVSRGGCETALVDGGVDASRLPVLDSPSAFVYTTPLATLVRLFLPGRTLGEPVHEVGFTWFAETSPLRSFPAGAEVTRVWDETLERLRSAAPLVAELESNPAVDVPSDARELWSSAADLAIVESVLTAARLPGRAVRLAEHPGRAENLEGARTIRSASAEVEELRAHGAPEEEAVRAAPRVVEEREASAAPSVARTLVFALLGVLSLWLAFAVFDSVPRIGLIILGAIFAAAAVVQGVRAAQFVRARRSTASE
ncbi:hypothetical protein GCM10009595_03980 [Falsarthrobacter nasiphocae]